MMPPFMPMNSQLPNSWIPMDILLQPSVYDSSHFTEIQEPRATSAQVQQAPARPPPPLRCPSPHPRTAEEIAETFNSVIASIHVYFHVIFMPISICSHQAFVPNSARSSILKQILAVIHSLYQGDQLSPHPGFFYSIGKDFSYSPRLLHALTSFSSTGLSSSCTLGSSRTSL